MDNLEHARRICEEAVGQSLASQACYMEKGRIYSLSHAQVMTEDSGVCVSLEVNKKNVRKVTEMMTNTLGKRPKMDFFCVLQADISVT